MAYELIAWTLANPDNLPTTATMGGALVSNMNFAEYGLPSEESGIREAFQHAFVEMGKQDPCFPAYHPKYQEWESTVYRLAFDPMWVGEQRDEPSPARSHMRARRRSWPASRRAR